MYILTNEGRKDINIFTLPSGEVTVTPQTANGDITIVSDSPSPAELIGAVLTSHTFTQPAIWSLGFLPSARTEETGVNNNILGVSKIIATANISEVIIADPHSKTAVDILQQELESRNIKLTILDIATIIKNSDIDLLQYDAIIAPGEGTVDRATSVANLANLPVITANKQCDSDRGNIASYSLNENIENGTYLVVDDICDDGQTFSALSDEFPENTIVDVFITHGIFNGDYAGENFYSYRNIITTNTLASAVDFSQNHYCVELVDILSLMGKN